MGDVLSGEMVTGIWLFSSGLQPAANSPQPLLWLVLIAFASYRLTLLMTEDEGPYIGWGPLKNEFCMGIFYRIRQLAGAYDYAENGLPPTNFARGISCPLCMGLYLTATVLFVAWLDWPPTNLLLVWLGVAGIQVFLTKVGSG